MKSVEPVRVTLTGEDLASIRGIANGAKRIVVSVTVPLTDQRTASGTLWLDPLEAQLRQAFYFDTQDLAASRAGLVVRAQRIKGGRADTVIKLLSASASAIDAGLCASADLEVEIESAADGFMCSATSKGRCKGREVLDVVTGAAPLRSLFSHEQIAFFDAHAPAGIELEQLVTLGPILLFRTKIRSQELDRRLVIELWHHPDGARILQISTKCYLEECSRVSAELGSYLASHGLTTTSDQATRTRTELELLRTGLQ